MERQVEESKVPLRFDQIQERDLEANYFFDEEGNLTKETKDFRFTSNEECWAFIQTLKDQELTPEDEAILDYFQNLIELPEGEEMHFDIEKIFSLNEMALRHPDFISKINAVATYVTGFIETDMDLPEDWINTQLKCCDILANMVSFDG